jgi:hypothetical protein
MKKQELFLNKECKVTFQNGFVLDGVVIEADDDGILLQTKQKTSFLNWKTIANIQPLEQ